MGKNVIFMLTTMLYLFMCAIESLNSSTDEYALLAFKFQITSDPNKILAKNWSQGTSFCNWIGVTCDGRYQRVTGLNLANMGLGGTIAKEIGELSSLRSLVASNNNFRGTIPDEMGNLSQLREIEIQDNELIGSIPSSFGFLDNLQKLNVSNNRLSGNIPNRIFNISSLIEIDFAINCLSGSLPMDICYSLPKLEMLIISTNQISGNIPPSLGTCTNIKLLSMAANLFTGNIPMEIGNLSKLEFLILAKNNLTGGIPNEIGNLSALAVLNLSYNRLNDFGITKLFTEDQRISLTKSLGTIGYMAPEYGSTGLISTTTDVYSYGIVLIETFTKKKPTSDIFDGEFTMRRWVFESFPNAIMQIVDTDLVNIVEENVRAKESFFKSIMGLALECTVELPQERPSMKDVPTRLKKFRNEFYESISQEK